MPRTYSVPYQMGASARGAAHAGGGLPRNFSVPHTMACPDFIAALSLPARPPPGGGGGAYGHAHGHLPGAHVHGPPAPLHDAYATPATPERKGAREMPHRLAATPPTPPTPPTPWERADGGGLAPSPATVPSPAPPPLAGWADADAALPPSFLGSGGDAALPRVSTADVLALGSLGT